MAKLRAVANRVYKIQGTIPTAVGIFTGYIIDEGPGAVIDPGPGACAPQLLEAMDDLEMVDPAFIIVTHVHMDHAGSCGELAARFPNARVVVHPEGKGHLADPRGLIRSTQKTYGEDFEHVYGAIQSVPEGRLCPATDGETFWLDGRPLEVIHAPGHAPHHMVVFDRNERGLFCGEALGTPVKSGRPIVLPCAAPPSFDVEVYLATVEKLARLKPRQLFYAHDQADDSVGREPEALISSVKENTRELLTVVKEGMQNQLTIEGLNSFVADHFARAHGMDRAEFEGPITVAGFMHYLNRNALTAPLPFLRREGRSGR